MRHGKCIGVFVLCIVLIFGLVPVKAAAAPVLRVGWYLVDGLHDFDSETGEYSGYDYEYLKAIAQFTGWEYEFVIEPFAECMADLNAGKLDLVGGVGKTPERERWFAYTQSSAGKAAPRLVVGQYDDRFAFEDFSAFDNIRVGAIQSSNLSKLLNHYAVQHNFNYELHSYASEQELQSALQRHEVDALFVSGTKNIREMRVIAQLPAESIYFITHADKIWIRDAMDNAISRLHFFDKNYENTLYQKYFSSYYTPLVSFSAAEKAYLDQQIASGRDLVVAYDPAWVPTEYRDAESGEFSGIMRDVFELISQRTGLKFKFVASDSYENTLQRYKENAEIFSTIAYDFNWADQHEAFLTQPLLDAQIFMVYNNAADPSDIVALPRGYYLARFLEEHEPAAQFVYYDTVADCIDAVRRNKAGKTYINEYEVNYYMDRFRLEHLNVQSVAGFTERIGIGISRQADPRLLSVFCRAIESISKNELNDILLAHTRNRAQPGIYEIFYAHPLQALLLLSIGVCLLLFAGFFYYSNRRTRHYNRVLQAANNAKSEFLSRVSHDIRTPMHAILGMARLAQRANASPEVAGYLSNIDSAGKFLSGLMNNILDMSVIENGELHLHPEEYSLQEFLGLLQSTIYPLAEAKNIEFTCDLHQVPDCIYVDSVRFNQIFLNLLDNAVKFTPAQGCVSLVMRYEAESEKGAMLHAVVSDTGIGIQEEFRSQLFMPFSQENHRHIDPKEGAGLGLAIVKRLTDAFGGEADVQSSPGCGTVVSINLPLRACEARKKENTTTVQWSSGDKIVRALVVEDDEINQEIVCFLLQHLGIQYVIAENGKEAVDRFSEQQPGWFQIIFMDLRMPVMNGMEAAAAIRRLPRQDAADVPIVAVTAEAYADIREQLMECGMTEYLAKPIQVEDIEKVLRKVL